MRVMMQPKKIFYYWNKIFINQKQKLSVFNNQFIDHFLNNQPSNKNWVAYTHIKLHIRQ